MSRAKRHRGVVPKPVPNLLQLCGEEDVVSLLLTFSLTTQLVLEVRMTMAWWEQLRELFVHPEFDDSLAAVSQVLDLTSPGLRFPALEVLSLKNQAVGGLLPAPHAHALTVRLR